MRVVARLSRGDFSQNECAVTRDVRSSARRWERERVCSRKKPEERRRTGRGGGGRFKERSVKREGRLGQKRENKGAKISALFGG